MRKAMGQSPAQFMKPAAHVVLVECVERKRVPHFSDDDGAAQWRLHSHGISQKLREALEGVPETYLAH